MKAQFTYHLLAFALTCVVAPTAFAKSTFDVTAGFGATRTLSGDYVPTEATPVSEVSVSGDVNDRLSLTVDFCNAELIGGFESTSLGLGTRVAITSWLALGGTLRYREIATTAAMETTIRSMVAGVSGDASDRRRYAATDLGMSTSLSSGWRFGALTVGVEWLSLYEPIAVLDHTLRTISMGGDGEPEVTAEEMVLGDTPMEVTYGKVRLGVNF